MGPIQAIRSVFGNYVNFGGRASRSEFWWFVGAYLVVNIVSLTFVPFDLAIILYFVILVGTIVPGLAVTVRRLHDIGHSGWWTLLALVSLLGLLLIPFLVLDSEPEQNQWGQPPVGSRYYAG